jgi:hypothetical protein
VLDTLTLGLTYLEQSRVGQGQIRRADTVDAKKCVQGSQILAIKNRNIRRQHCKKRLAIFPSPAVMSLTKLSLRGIIMYLFPARRSFAGYGIKVANFFYSAGGRCTCYTLHVLYDISTIKLLGKERKPITVLPMIQL